jgi:hypothetical protein
MESNKPKLTFAKKPQLRPNLRNHKEVSIVCNQLLLRLSQNNQPVGVQQYHFEITPELGENMIKERKELFRDLRDSIVLVYGRKYYVTGDSLFGTKFVDGDQEFTNGTYSVKLSKTRNFVDLSQINTTSVDDVKVKAHLEIILKSILKENDHLVNFKNQYYDFKSKTDLNSKIN